MSLFACNLSRRVNQRVGALSVHRHFCCNRHEAAVQEALIRNPPSQYERLYKQEYHVVPGKSHLGVGDLIFQNPKQPNKFLVVETKHLRPNASKKTNRSKRQHARRQAEFYGSRLKAAKPNACIKKAIYDNLGGIQFI